MKSGAHVNGRQLADEARTGRPRLQVLFITGYAENAVLNHGHLDPGMHVMTKPFVGETFGRRVRELISKNLAPSAHVSDHLDLGGQVSSLAHRCKQTGIFRLGRSIGAASFSVLSPCSDTGALVGDSMSGARPHPTHAEFPS
jgi:DNA-binding LytR/AlgR family response regulator